MRKVSFLMVFFLLCFGWRVASAQDEHVVQIPGQVAYVGVDGNVYTFDAFNHNVVALTEDADNFRRYQWPTWAIDNQLAYFCCEPLLGVRPRLEIYVADEGGSPGRQIYNQPGEAFTYAGWAPSGCDPESLCRDLAVLRGRVGSSALAIEIFRDIGAGEAEVRSPGIGAPFYFSWSPDGRQMLLQRYEERLEVFNVDDSALELLDPLPGMFQAPEWSPVDDRLLFGVLNDEGTTDLVVQANGESVILDSGLPGRIAFNWSPDGNHVAYRTFDGERFSPLIVLDSLTGKTVSVSPNLDVIAFFWSPDSQRIAYVTLATPPGTLAQNQATYQTMSAPAQQTDGLAWFVLEVTTGEGRRYGNFIPSNEMVYLLSYFDQFSQSHQIWSPGSSHIVFGEVSLEGDPVISILDMSRADTVPFSIADGVIGIWSYR